MQFKHSTRQKSRFASAPRLTDSLLICLQVTVLTWIIGFAVMLINIYFVSSALLQWLLHSGISTSSRVLLGLSGVAGILIYLGAIIYLALRTDREVTYLLSDVENFQEGILSDDEVSGEPSEVELHGLLKPSDKRDSSVLDHQDSKGGS